MSEGDRDIKLAALREGLRGISLAQYIALGWQQGWWSAVRPVGGYCRVNVAARAIN